MVAAFSAACNATRVPRGAVVVRAQAQQEEAELVASRRNVLTSGASVLAASAVPLATAVGPAMANTVVSAEWEQVRHESEVCTCSI